MSEPTFHVLLIGADGYFPNVLPNRASYPSLGGCVNDVMRVEAMLRARIKGHALAITRLLGPAGPGGAPTGDEAQWPTAANIRAALAALAERAQPGDQVYIHYSGHGGRVVTAWKALKSDGVDEALVPIDIGRPDEPGGPIRTRPERYIRDVELARTLDRLAGKVEGDRKVTTTLVFDSCHAGGATRGLGAIAKRSAIGGVPDGGDPWGTLDTGELDAHAFSDVERAGMVEAYGRLRASTRAATPAATWLPPARGYVLLAACRDVEAAIEGSLDGRPHSGVLTDALLEALGSLGAEQSWKTVYDRVLARVHSRFASQTPQLVGEIERHIFGVALAEVPHALAVQEVDAARRRVIINGGLALTITRGTTLAIYRPGTTDFSLPAGRLAIATVVDAEGLRSTATLDATSDASAIPPGAPAVVQSTPLRRTVELLTRTDLSLAVAAQQARALAAVGQAIETEGKGFLEVAARGAAPHYQIAVSPTGRYEVCDPQGKAFQYLEPTIALDDARAAGQVVAQLRRLGRYHTVLDMAAPAGDLVDQLQVELLRAPPDWDDTQAPRATGGAPLERTGDAYTVDDETWLWLRLTNKEPRKPLNIALLDLTRTWQIEMIIPNRAALAHQPYETIGDRSRTFAFKMYTPVPEAIDILKLFIATGHVDFAALTTTVSRTRSADVARNALGRLVDAINATEHRTREVAPARSVDSPWTVREFRMRTLQT